MFAGLGVRCVGCQRSCLASSCCTLLSFLTLLCPFQCLFCHLPRCDRSPLWVAVAFLAGDQREAKAPDHTCPYTAAPQLERGQGAGASRAAGQVATLHPTRGKGWRVHVPQAHQTSQTRHQARCKARKEGSGQSRPEVHPQAQRGREGTAP